MQYVVVAVELVDNGDCDQQLAYKFVQLEPLASEFLHPLNELVDVCLVVALQQTPRHIFYQWLRSDSVRSNVVVFVMNDIRDVDDLWVSEWNELVLT